ncbi:50S ribosomal protein L17 [Candidatus Sulfidibacterium hydrothermale]|uniref:50S ribosomal protein L17 n=1 Tax=Candidatus Sulfidibacterium hydrothermale TaxID=2875962 RepID=UPI001F0A9A33|nr:50S ribosomal protein L17 [Candidatus Sulfidibacterium hydrothermale]
MRHRKSFNHLGRTSSHRKAMLANMATSLILHKRITTTVAKAKALRSYVEPLITRSKDDTTHSRRIVFSYLQSKEAVTELFREVAKKVADRPGGYTRIIKLGNRVGDNAELAMMELVDFNETLLAEKSATKAKSTRRRRGGKKKSTATAQKEAPADTAKETAKEAEVKKEEKVEEKPVEKVAEKKEEAPAAETKKEEAPKSEVKEEKKEPKSEKKQEEKGEKKDENKKEE